MTKLDTGMRLIAILIADVLNPLFMISLALFVSLGYILTLLMPVTIDVWQAVFWVSALIPFIGLSARVYAKRKQGVYAKNRPSWRMLLPFIPLLVLAPRVVGELSLPGMQIWVHAGMRLGYAHQLLYGSTPVENIFVAGHPANYYWLYHAYMATVAKITSLHPLYVTEIVNIIAVFSGLLWLAQTLIVLKLAKPRTVYLGAAVILVYFAVNVTGPLSLAAYLADGNAMPDSWAPRAVRATLLEGADRRLHGVSTKVFNASSMALSLMAFCALLYICVKMLKGKIDLLALILVSACGIAVLAIRADFALYMALLGIALAGSIGLMGRPSKAERMLKASREISPAAWLLWFIISLVLSLPLLKYNLDIVASLPGLEFDLFNAANIRIIVMAVLLLIPLFALQCVFAWQKRDPAQRFVQIGFLILFLLTSSLQINGEHSEQYQAVYLLAILIAISALFALQRLQQSSRIAWRRAGWMIAAVWFILVVLQIMYGSYCAWSRATENGTYRYYEYDGAHLKYEGERDDGRAAAYYWIRGNTSTDSIIVLPLDVFHFQWSNLLHERLLYVKAPLGSYTDTIEAYDERVSHLEAFYNEATAMDDYWAMQASMARNLPGRPIYAVVKDAEVSPEVMERRGAKLVYEDENDGANVYRLNPQE